MKDEVAGVAIEEFVGLNPNMYLYLADDNSEHKKIKRYEQKCCCGNKSQGI